VTAGLVLAAGAGVRFGGPKAPFVLDGERLVDRAVRVMTEAGCDPVIVVLGAWIGDVPGAVVVVNEEWPEGMGSSLRAGLSALTSMADVGAVIVTLVDLPGLTAAGVRPFLESPALIAAATFDGERGHPVKFAREHWADVSAVARGDEGARRFLKGRSDVVLIEIGDVAVGLDMDTPPAGESLVEKDGHWVIPASGEKVTDETMRKLIDEGRQ
jgi:CTP:molybdopterin cytidylyltransferase MocA